MRTVPAVVESSAGRVLRLRRERGGCCVGSRRAGPAGARSPRLFRRSRRETRGEARAACGWFCGRQGGTGRRGCGRTDREPSLEQSRGAGVGSARRGGGPGFKAERVSCGRGAATQKGTGDTGVAGRCWGPFESGGHNPSPPGRGGADAQGRGRERPAAGQGTGGADRSWGCVTSRGLADGEGGWGPGGGGSVARSLVFPEGAAGTRGAGQRPEPRALE